MHILVDTIAHRIIQPYQEKGIPCLAQTSRRGEEPAQFQNESFTRKLGGQIKKCNNEQRDDVGIWGLRARQAGI